MTNLISMNVWRHLGAQIGVAALVAALAAVAHADYSALGVYAPLAQSFAALIMSIVNEALGTAPAPKA